MPMSRSVKQVIKEYPFLEISKDATKSGITWLDSIDTGWLKRFGVDLCDDLKEAIKKDNCEKDFMIVEIKEKFGFMNLYVLGAGEYTNEVISKYEELSKYVCGFCGQTADYMTTGWNYPICKQCAETRLRDDRYMTIEQFYGFNDHNEVLQHIVSIETS